MVYVDDVLVFGRTFAEHHQRLATVFSGIKFADLCLNLTRCSFAKRETTFLGHAVRPDGVRPDPLLVIAELHSPTNVSHI